jgi:hypothetical protein
VNRRRDFFFVISLRWEYQFLFNLLEVNGKLPNLFGGLAPAAASSAFSVIGEPGELLARSTSPRRPLLFPRLETSFFGLDYSK